MCTCELAGGIGSKHTKKNTMLGIRLFSDEQCGFLPASERRLHPAQRESIRFGRPCNLATRFAHINTYQVAINNPVGTSDGKASENTNDGSTGHTTQHFLPHVSHYRIAALRWSCFSGNKIGLGRRNLVTPPVPCSLKSHINMGNRLSFFRGLLRWLSQLPHFDFLG